MGPASLAFLTGARIFSCRAAIAGDIVAQAVLPEQGMRQDRGLSERFAATARGLSVPRESGSARVRRRSGVP